jgi:DNA polymerase
LSEAERKNWELSERINDTGFHIDRGPTVGGREVGVKELATVNTEIVELTDGVVSSAHQTKKIITFVNDHGHRRLTNLDKRTVAAVLAHEPDGETRRLLELRRDGAVAAAGKFNALLASLSDDDRLRGCFLFHRQRTGRWAGTRFQPQNLKKPKLKGLDTAIAAVRAGDLEQVRRMAPPLAVIGDLSRALVTAAPGHVLIGADFSSIESRVLAWFAGETWKLRTYREFDHTGDPQLEPYCTIASKILQRRVTLDYEAGRGAGKLFDLSFSYGSGLSGFRNIDPSDTYSDQEVENFKNQWRDAHPNICRFWNALFYFLRRALRLKQRIAFYRLVIEFEDPTLYITLPSGRRLVYRDARIEPGKFAGSQDITFEDAVRGRINGWYGVFVENVVCATARDLLAAAMLRIDAAGYPIVLHCHDEIVAEVPEHFGSVDEFVELMTILPPWAAGLRCRGRTTSVLWRDRGQSGADANQSARCGAGEAGTVGSLSAGVNAIVDALSVLGIKHIDMPCTPYRVWQAIVNVGADHG